MPKKQKLPASVGKGRGRPGNFSMAERMKDVLGFKAYKVEVARRYCETVGLDSRSATVMDCLIHCQLSNAFTGSAPHISQIWDRIDGKVTQETKVNVSSRTNGFQYLCLVNHIVEATTMNPRTKTRALVPTTLTIRFRNLVRKGSCRVRAGASKAGDGPPLA